MPQTRRRLNPLGALVLTRERIQEVLDDAVARGRMTRDDATELFAELVRRGTAPADRVIRGVGERAARRAEPRAAAHRARPRASQREPQVGARGDRS